MKNEITLFLICLFLITTAANAQITIDGANHNWSRIENNTPIVLAYTDADNGDGINDGAILIKGTTNTTALQGVKFLLSGSPLNGEEINLEAKYFQYAASYVKFKMQLYNATDNLVLAETAVITTTTGVIGTATLAYTFTTSCIGDQIMVRFVRADDLNPVRVLALDYLKVNGQL